MANPPKRLLYFGGSTDTSFSRQISVYRKAPACSIPLRMFGQRAPMMLVMTASAIARYIGSTPSPHAFNTYTPPGFMVATAILPLRNSQGSNYYPNTKDST